MKLPSAPTFKPAAYKAPSVKISIPAAHVLKVNAAKVHVAVPKSPKITVGQSVHVPGVSATPVGRPGRFSLNPPKTDLGPAVKK